MTLPLVWKNGFTPLYSQIDKSLLRKIAIELSIDLKPLGAGLGAKIKPIQPEETRYSKLRLVVEYIEKHLKVGWVDAPETYFKGSLPMIWGLLRHMRPSEEAPYAVYFGGKTSRTVFGMVGSAHHLVGLRSDAPKSETIVYYTPNEILKMLANDTEMPSLDVLKIAEREITGVVTTAIIRGTEKNASQHLEFLAKTYLHEDFNNNSLLLGSPIYVAFAD